MSHHLCKQPCFPEEFFVTFGPYRRVICSLATRTASPSADPAGASWSSGTLCGHGYYCKALKNTVRIWQHCSLHKKLDKMMRMLKIKNKNWEDEANLKFSRQELNILWTAMFRSHAPYHITNTVCSREQNKKFPEQSYLTSPCFKTLVLVQPCDKTVFSCVKKRQLLICIF